MTLTTSSSTHSTAVDPHSPPPVEWVLLTVDGDRCLFDVTFLASHWGCLWSKGECSGLRDEGEPAHGNGCCQMGAWLDEDERPALESAVAQLTDEDWDPRLRKRRRHENGLVRASARDWKTQQLDGACIFHNRDGRGCAFHQLADRTGQNVMDLKPEVCWIVPLTFTPSENGAPAILKGREDEDWTESGEDPEWEWWCVTGNEPNAYSSEHPVVYESMEQEITRLVGPALYAALVDYMGNREGQWMSVPVPQLLQITPRPSGGE